MENNYIITGGDEGKKRLAILADILHEQTKALIEVGGPISGKRFLDLGCGGGAVSLLAAKMTDDNGYVKAIDFDREIISLARKDAIEESMLNVSFEVCSAYDIVFNNEFDIAYSRFLFSHLENPMIVLQRMIDAVKLGGRIIVEDIQFSGHFCYPACKAFDAYLHYFTTAAKNNNHNPEIGSSLFTLFNEAGIEQIHFDFIQPCFNKGIGKWMACMTMDKIKDTVIKQGLADEETISAVLKELEEFTKDEQTIISLPRIFRVWGVKKNY